MDFFWPSWWTMVNPNMFNMWGSFQWIFVDFTGRRLGFDVGVSSAKKSHVRSFGFVWKSDTPKSRGLSSFSPFILTCARYKTRLHDHPTPLLLLSRKSKPAGSTEPEKHLINGNFTLLQWSNGPNAMQLESSQRWGRLNPQIGRPTAWFSRKFTQSGLFNIRWD